MSVPKGEDVGLQWRELRWSCLRSCRLGPPCGVRRSQQKKEIRLLSALILKERILKAPANTEMHLPESSELQVRYFQGTTRDATSLKDVPCPEKASLYHGPASPAGTFWSPRLAPCLHCVCASWVG